MKKVIKKLENYYNKNNLVGIYSIMNRKNKGFTLVELIVVIVILAILIGVTIVGIYMYVGKARLNIDIHNNEINK